MTTRIVKKAAGWHQFFQHLFFWLISLVLFTVFLVYSRGDFSFKDLDFRITFSILVTVLFLSVSVYINLLWLIPVFFNRRKFWQFTLLELANIALFILLNYWISYLFEGGGHPNIIAEIIAEFILVLIFLIFSTLLKSMRDSITLQDVELKMKEVEKQKVEAELRALKAQVNPHFFFNTLNSLYSLSLDKSDKAPEMILKLSDLMRYVIYGSRDENVPISQQLEFLKSYVYLEQARSPEYLRVNFQVSGENLDIKLSPLLFLAFIENAFKHGSKVRDSGPYIDILFDLSRHDRVCFSVENSIDPDNKATGRGGVGLTNARKQLELLYHDRYTLLTEHNPDKYRVELTIMLI